jgi:D-sedoheptulose 7-phosphate isomerase
MKTVILEILKESISVKEQFFKNNLDRILEGVDILSQCLASGHKILLFGNGGSAADAQHLAAEFVNRFRIERPPLAALALTTDSSVLTSIGNDYSFNDIFSKQVRALGRPDDVVIGISTSGNSPNVIAGVEAARQLGLYTIGLGGRGGKLAQAVDLAYCVESDTTARIQETHITLGHVLCELVDRTLFPTRDRT